MPISGIVLGIECARIDGDGAGASAGDGKLVGGAVTGRIPNDRILGQRKSEDGAVGGHADLDRSFIVRVLVEDRENGAVDVVDAVFERLMP